MKTACTQDTFSATGNKNANGAMGYSKGIIHVCQSQRLSMGASVAFDFDPSLTNEKCLIHTDNVKAANLMVSIGVIHYQRQKCPTSRASYHSLFIFVI